MNTDTGDIRQGRFIVLEGINGGGKDTQMLLLEKRLNQVGCSCLPMWEPAYPCPPGLTVTEQVDFFTTTRRKHVQSINGILDQGLHILCSRFWYSTLVYQGMLGADEAAIRDEHTAFCPVPDLVLWLDLPGPCCLEPTPRAGGCLFCPGESY